MKHKRILIIADIEGSSNCLDYESTKFLGKGWPKACLGLTKDVNAVVKVLFESGVQKIYVKDFHRTGHNIFANLIDKRAKLIPGFKTGPVPGLGSVYDATGLMMIGMHAPSGSKGFLAHTLTSRISRLEVNGKLMTEAELFAASVAPFGLKPLFFSGCPIACEYASSAIFGLKSFPIEIKVRKDEKMAVKWRKDLGRAAEESLNNNQNKTFFPKGPFHAKITMKDGADTALKIAKRWKMDSKDSDILIDTDDMNSLYLDLIKICYLRPFAKYLLPVGLPIFNFIGKSGLWWTKKRLVL